MNGTPAAKARRNLTNTIHRQMWKDAHSEDHPLRYRLHYPDGMRNIKTGRAGLLAEIRETKPVQIERIPLKGDDCNFASVSEHLRFLGNMSVVEVVWSGMN